MSARGSRPTSRAAGRRIAGRGDFVRRSAAAVRAASGERVMNANRPEFSRIVSLAQLGSEPFRQEIAATEAEREALARRFDLIALDRLAAEVELIRQEADFILLRASFEAAFAQSCVVTLDPGEGRSEEHK